MKITRRGFVGLLGAIAAGVIGRRGEAKTVVGVGPAAPGAETTKHVLAVQLPHKDAYIAIDDNIGEISGMEIEVQGAIVSDAQSTKICECRWRRDEKYGNVMDQYAAHREETNRYVTEFDEKYYKSDAWQKMLNKSRAKVVVIGPIKVKVPDTDRWFFELDRKLTKKLR